LDLTFVTATTPVRSVKFHHHRKISIGVDADRADIAKVLRAASLAERP
jgi:hypothetical protein